MAKKKEELKFLSFDEWERLSRMEMPERDRLILRVLYETGSTVNEFVHMRVRDIEYSLGRILINYARNKLKRYVYISDSTIEMLRSITKGSKPDDFIFSTRQSGCITTKRVRQIVAYYCGRISVEDAGPQLIRYTHIVHAYLKDVPLNEIQKQVGLRRSRAIELFSQLPEKPTRQAYRNFLG